MSVDADALFTQVTGCCPELAALAGHITGFAGMLTGRHGERLDAWISASDAVRNGLTLPRSSGTVEGNVN